MISNLDTIKKVFITGLGAALMTEEGLLKFLSELKLSGDIKNYLLSQAEKKKEDITRIIAGELNKFLGKVNLHEEMRKALAGLIVDVNATVRIDDPTSGIRVTKSKVSAKKS